ncbi:MAG: flavin reductase [Syntrophaceae bacterium]|nr:flavin reductase [Deltaproteobacteria bacterium]
MAEKPERMALWDITYGLYIVSSRSGEKLNGQIANTVFQVSAAPPTIAVSINKNNLTHAYINESGVLSVTVLEEDTPMPFIGNFGFKSGREVDKMSQVTCRFGQTGCPLVTDHALSVLEAKVTGTLDCGTHTIFVGEVVSSEVLRQGNPLTYAFYQNVKKGKAPKNAPTYKGEVHSASAAQEKTVEVPMQKYVCGVCGYVYDPEQGDPEGDIPAGTPFEKLPDEWTCPVCGAPKSEFTPE